MRTQCAHCYSTQPVCLSPHQWIVDRDLPGAYFELPLSRNYSRSASQLSSSSTRYDDSREMRGGASHRGGRLVVYDSTILRLNRPPAVQCLQGQLMFQVQFSTSKKRMKDGHTKWVSYREVNGFVNKPACHSDGALWHIVHNCDGLLRIAMDCDVSWQNITELDESWHIVRDCDR